ncbi:MAG: DUF5693 family protein [Abditibacteriaceae bacterium]
MPNRQNRFRLGWILITIAVINCIFWAGFRWHYENTMRVAQLTVDYDDTSVLADAYGIPFPDLLQKLKGSGISSVGLYDLSISNLVANGRVTLLQSGEASPLYPAISWGKYNALLVFNASDKTLYQQVLAHLKTQSPAAFPPRATPLGKQLGIVILFSKQLINDANVGFDPLQLKQVHDAGLTVTARLSNPLNLTIAQVNSILDDTQKAGAKVVIFSADEVMGNSTLIKPVAVEMQKRGLLFGNIEFGKQLGWEGLSRLANGELVRVHSVGADEISKATPATLVERYSLAVKERDMRVAYIRLIRQEKGDLTKAPDGTLITKDTALQQNLDFIQEIKTDLEKQPLPFAWLRPGMTMGTAQAFGNYPMTQLTAMTGSVSAAKALRHLGLFLAALGVVGATLLMLNLFFDLSSTSENKWLMVGILLALLLLFLDAASGKAHSGESTGGALRLLGMWPQNMGIKLMALEVGCLVPAIAILWGGLPQLWNDIEKTEGAIQPSFTSTFSRGVRVLLCTSLILAIGPLMIITLLNAWPFFSGADKFLLTKLTQLIPLILVVIAFAGAIFPHRVMAESSAAARQHAFAFWKNIMASPLTVSLTVISLVVIVGGLVWMARSGNDSGLTVSSFELHFRHLLERILVTRPRTKEFVLGFPATLFAVWFATRKRWMGAFFAMILATIGQADMMDSFMHLHTPIFYALMRSIYALVIGIIGGGIVLWFCDRWVRKQNK